MGGLRASKTTTAAFDFANYDEDLDLGRLRKPDFPETVGCRFSLRNLCGGPRYRSDVDDEYAHSVAIYDFAVVDSGFTAFLLVHTPRRRPRRHGGPEEVTVCGESWLATAAAGLAILGCLHLLNPYVILASVFLIGIGFAVNAPAWTSSVSEVVSNDELPSAATLGGLQLNISGIIGPALGGLLVPIIGPNFVFAVNAACFLVVILAVLRWKRIATQSRTGTTAHFYGPIRFSSAS